MKNRILPFLCFIFLYSLLPAQEFANQMEDTMYDTGRINVVLAVVMIIFVIFFGYLIRLDRKLTKLEKEV